MRRKKKDEIKRARAEEIRMQREAYRATLPPPPPEPARIVKFVKAVKPLDWLVLAAGVLYFVFLVDFSYFTLSNVFFCTGMLIWSGSFIVRLYLMSKNGDF